MFEYKIEYIVRAGAKLALHSWLPKKPKAMLFYIHGKQSHGGWLFETGPFLAKQSIVLFVLDRRGSGLSGREKGNVESLETMLLDYKMILDIVRNRFQNLPLTLFGQSFGGSVLAGLLFWNNFEINYDAVVFCASGLGLQSLHLSNKKIELDKKMVSLNLSDEAYTSNPKYLKFMRDDVLCAKIITESTRRAFLELEKIYCKSDCKISVPSFFIRPECDPIVDFDIPIEIFKNLTGNNGALLQLPLQHHYIEFSEQRFQLWRWLSSYTLTSGYRYYD